MKTLTEHDIKFQPSTLENIDGAMLQYLEKLGIGANTNEGWRIIPVIWQGAEKAFQIKNDKELRDLNEILILPQITLLRTTVSKKLDRKGIFLNDSARQDKLQQGEIVIAQELNQTKTAAFANNRAIGKTNGRLNFKTVADENEKRVFKFFSIQTPVYLDLRYEITIRTEYQSQMNEILSVFLTRSGSLNYFLVENGGYRYECFFDEELGVDNNITNFDEEERVFKTTVGVDVLGYIIGADNNKERPHLTVKENRVDVKVVETVFSTMEEFEEALKKNKC